MSKPTDSSDSTIRINDPPKNLTSSSDVCYYFTNRLLKEEKETLLRQTKEIEQKCHEDDRILKIQLLDKEEQCENLEKKAQKSEEKLQKERNEKKELIEEKKNEKELERKLNETEQLKHIAEQQLYLEKEQKKELIERAKEAEQKLKLENKKRKEIENNNDKLLWKNVQLTNEVERLKNKYNSESSLVSEYETKYLAEVELKEKEKKNTLDEVNKRQQIDKEKRQLQKEKSDLIEQSQIPPADPSCYQLDPNVQTYFYSELTADDIS
ncbi:MAG: hypothetical protein EZS28_040053, partial [Streblomastix strix]